MSEAPLLEVDRLVTQYPVRRSLTGRLAREPRLQVHAVDGVSFCLARGEMLALVGESGCGKTSTAQTILRMVNSTSGTIRLNGTDITRLSQQQMRPLRRKLQMIYQDPYESLDPRFRVQDAVEEPMLVHGIGSSRAERRDLVGGHEPGLEQQPPDERALAVVDAAARDEAQQARGHGPAQK